MQNQKKTRSTAFSKFVWSKVLQAQYLAGISDEQLGALLGVTTRTLCNYRKDPSLVTLRQLQLVVENFGLDPEVLFRS